jgi:hypothetical protein
MLGNATYERHLCPENAGKEGLMVQLVRISLTVGLAITLLTGLVAHVGETQKPAGAVTFAGSVATPASGESGVTWGKGTLILNDGSQHGFEVIGLGVTGTREAVVTVHAVGAVFNLRQLLDFEGTYKAAQHEVRAGRATEDVTLTNERGVIVALSVKAPATTADVTLTPSPTGITVKLEK